MGRATKTASPSPIPSNSRVLCDDRFGMLKQITAVISDTHTNIRNIEARTATAKPTSTWSSKSPT